MSRARQIGHENFHKKISDPNSVRDCRKSSLETAFAIFLEHRIVVMDSRKQNSQWQISFQ
jgi:hypothetical protein